MKVRELIEQLKGYEDSNVLFGSDEELNCLRSRGEVAEIETGNEKDEPCVVIYGFDGSEVDFGGKV